MQSGYLSLDLPHSKFDAFEDLFDFDFNASIASSASQVRHASTILQEHVARLESPHVQVEGAYPDKATIAIAFSQLFDSPWFSRL